VIAEICFATADGYYAWKKMKGGQKQPYLARNADGSPFAFELKTKGNKSLNSDKIPKLSR